MSEYDAHAFDAYEQAGWEAIAGRFAERWSPITSQAIDYLLEKAHIGQGSRLLDVGTGPGDAAGRAVERGAEATGIDVAAAMVEIAAERHPDATFLQASASDLPFPDGSFDAVVGNNVIQHVGEPQRAAREMRRVLAPGGRVAVSDIALFQPLPDSIRTMVEALVGCVAGAALVADIEKTMREAGLVDIQLTPKADYVAAMSNADDPLFRRVVELLPAGSKVADYVTSLDIRARKP